MKRILQKTLLLILSSFYLFATPAPKWSQSLLNQARKVCGFSSTASDEEISQALLYSVGHVEKIRDRAFKIGLATGIASWMVYAIYHKLHYNTFPVWIVGCAGLSIPLTTVAFATGISTENHIGVFSIPLGAGAGLALGAACGYLFSPVDTPFMQGAWNGMKYNSLSLAGYTAAALLQLYMRLK